VFKLTKLRVYKSNKLIQVKSETFI